MTERNLFKTEHARHGQAFCLAKGLFYSAPKGKREDLFLDVIYKTTKATFHFTSRWHQGVTEMRVLQGLVALASISGDHNNAIRLTSETVSEVGKEHRRTLEFQDEAVDMDALIVKTTFYELAKEIGYSESSFHSGRQVKIIRNALERLQTVNVVVVYKDGSRRESYNIISKYINTSDDKFTVAINPHIAECIIGKRNYTKLEMKEIRDLETDPGRLIHQRLCGWINPGRNGTVTVNTLCEYVWCKQSSKTNINTIKYRKIAVKNALAELKGLGWKVKEYTKDKYKITRRRSPK